MRFEIKLDHLSTYFFFIISHLQFNSSLFFSFNVFALNIKVNGFVGCQTQALLRDPFHLSIYGQGSDKFKREEIVKSNQIKTTKKYNKINNRGK